MHSINQRPYDYDARVRGKDKVSLKVTQKILKVIWKTTVMIAHCLDTAAITWRVTDCDHLLLFINSTCGTLFLDVN